MEIPFLFNVTGHPDVFRLVGENALSELADTIQDVWISFARDGVPDSPHVPSWPVFNTGTRETMIINTTWTVESDPYGSDRILWKEVYP